MNLLVFQNLRSRISGAGYNNAIKISYLIGNKLISHGIGDIYYYIKEFTSGLKQPDKIAFIKRTCALDQELIQSVTDYEQIVKSYNKKGHHKSSKEIINLKLIDKEFQRIYEYAVDKEKLVLNDFFGLNELKPLIDEDVFRLLDLEIDENEDLTKKFSPLVSVLTLHLPEDISNFIFFLNLESNIKEAENFAVNFVDSDHKTAINEDVTYANESFSFASLSDLNQDALILFRHQLKGETEDFRTKIDQWAKICYDNPTSNEGLEFFKTNIKPILKQPETVLKNNKAFVKQTQEEGQIKEYQLIIGQMPILDIWKLMFEMNSIKDEEYSDLMLYYEQNKERFIGKWPIIFLKPNVLENQNNSEIQDEIEVKSVRKTISLD